MKITIILDTSLEIYSLSGEAEMTMDISCGTTIEDVIHTLHIPRWTTDLIIINNKIIKENCPLKDGDVVQFFPIVGGG